MIGAAGPSGEVGVESLCTMSGRSSPPPGLGLWPLVLLEPHAALLVRTNVARGSHSL